jgi:hypothetical protein
MSHVKTQTPRYIETWWAWRENSLFIFFARPKKRTKRKGAQSLGPLGFICASRKVRRSRKLPAFAKASAGQTVHESNPDLSAMLDLVMTGLKRAFARERLTADGKWLHPEILDL